MRGRLVAIGTTEVPVDGDDNLYRAAFTDLSYISNVCGGFHVSLLDKTGVGIQMIRVIITIGGTVRCHFDAMDG